jgi:hypothetical protein
MQPGIDFDPETHEESNGFAVRKRVRDDLGRLRPVLSVAETRQVLQNFIAGRAGHDDNRLLSGAMSFDQHSDNEEIVALRWDFVIAHIKKTLGQDYFERLAEEMNAPAAEPPPSKEQLAAEKANDIFTVIHALKGVHKKKNGQPLWGMIARELWRRGYELRDILDAGLNRGIVSDARTYVRAQLIEAGEVLPKNLEITTPGRWKRGSVDRSSTGKLALENVAASRVLSRVGDLVAVEKPTGTRKAFTNTVEGIAKYEEESEENDA